MKSDEYFMEIALNEAIKGKERDETPIGAVLVDKSGQILSTAYNRTVRLSDPTAHAEILCIRDAARLIMKECIQARIRSG